MRLSRKQIIAIILKKKGIIGSFFSVARPPAVGLHRVAPEARVHRFLRAYMKSAPVESVKLNPAAGSIFDSWVVQLKGRQKAIFKEKGSYAELLAYKVDRVMGFNRVPAVVSRNIRTPDGVTRFGSLMQWSKKSPLAFGRRPDPVMLRRLSTSDVQEAFHEMRMFDYVINNSDRHGGNFLVALHGKQKIIPIDHALSFNTAETPRQLFDMRGFDANLRALSLASRKKLLLRLDRLTKKRRYLAFSSTEFPDTQAWRSTLHWHDRNVDDMLERAEYLKSYIRAEGLDKS